MIIIWIYKLSKRNCLDHSFKLNTVFWKSEKYYKLSMSRFKIIVAITLLIITMARNDVKIIIINFINSYIIIIGNIFKKNMNNFLNIFFSRYFI